MAKLWAGRFSKNVNEAVDALNASIAIDKRMFREDIAGSIAHAKMLADSDIISKSEGEALVIGLEKILEDIQSGTLLIDPGAEDIHMFVEQVLTERIGVVGKKLHTGRSRNDQVALDLRLYLKKQTLDLMEGIESLILVLLDLAAEHTESLMPGYTHLQIAQPVSMGHHLMAYAQMLYRDFTRLGDAFERMDEMPLGSGALAGTSYPLNRELVAELLGFSRITENSMDGVSDRDFCVELASAISLIMAHLSRLAEDMILWNSSEFSFIELDDAFATGSSIMPQKKNPDVLELVRGKTGRVNGNVIALLTVLKGLPMTYNKDLQEDKEAIFDSFDTLFSILEAFIPMMKTLTIKKEVLRKAASKGMIQATDCADYLVRKGLAFREAYSIVGKAVSYCIEKEKTFETLTLKEYHIFHTVFDEDIYKELDLDRILASRSLRGGPAPSAVQIQIQALKNKLKKNPYSTCN